MACARLHWSRATLQARPWLHQCAGLRVYVMSVVSVGQSLKYAHTGMQEGWAVSVVRLEEKAPSQFAARLSHSNPQGCHLDVTGNDIVQVGRAFLLFGMAVGAIDSTVVAGARVGDIVKCADQVADGCVVSHRPVVFA